MEGAWQLDAVSKSAGKEDGWLITLSWSLLRFLSPPWDSQRAAFKKTKVLKQW